MVDICKYSILIYAGNVTILLIVAIATDYWEYRGFDTDAVNQSLTEIHGIRVVKPQDTDSYMIVNYRKQPKTLTSHIRHISRDRLENNDWMTRIVPYGSSHIGSNFYRKNETEDEPPLFVRRYYGGGMRTEDGDARSFVEEELLNDMEETEEVIFVLYWQHGNLFRDCDNLEAHVRQRLAMSDAGRQQCYTFFVGGRPGSFFTHIPDVVYLEMTSFTTAILCIGCMAGSLVFGAIGSFDKSKRALFYASTSSLAAGFFLILSIALFNGKSHLIRRREITFRSPIGSDAIVDALNAHRKFSHGWSFVLAWICVVLCFVSSYVWLYKGENLGYRGYSVRGRKYFLKRWKRARKYLENTAESAD